MVLIPYGDDEAGRRSTPVIVPLLVLANIAVFLYQAFSPATFTTGYSVVPHEWINNVDLVQLMRVDGQALPHGPGPSPIYLTVFTAMFMHGDVFHLIFNLLFLYVFGARVEDHLGKFKFLCFYLLCGILATFAHILGNWGSVIPCLGASGAISGILGAYFRRFPGRWIYLLLFFFIPIRMPAFIVIGLWFLTQILSYHAGNGTGVAYLAHIGGFLAGLWLVGKFLQKS